VSPHLHHVTISGLSPGTVYSYKIGLEDLTVRTFTTGLLPGDFPAGGKPFVATFVGDIGTTSVRRSGAKRERERNSARTLHAPLPRARELALQEVAEATLVAYRMRLTPASQRQQPRLRFTICPFLVLTPFPPLFLTFLSVQAGRTTIHHLEDNAAAAFHYFIGDLSYAGCDQPRWDDYGKLVSGYVSVSSYE